MCRNKRQNSIIRLVSLLQNYPYVFISTVKQMGRICADLEILFSAIFEKPFKPFSTKYSR